MARISGVLQISTLSAEKSFSKFYASLRPTGLSLEQIEVIMVGVSNAARLSGASSSEMAAGMLQLKQAFSSGRASGDELRSLLENFPRYAVATAEAFDKINGTTGTTVGQLRQLGAEGKLTADVLFEASKQLAALDVPAPTNLEGLKKGFDEFAKSVAKAIGPQLSKA